MSEGLFVVSGWCGFAFCSLAYLLLNLKVVRFDSLLYQVLNILGGSGLVVSALYFNDDPNLAANIVWVLIAILGIVRYSKSHSRRRDNGREIKSQ